MLDLLLAITHHLAIFALFGVLFAELVLVRQGLEAPTIATVGKIDLWYGILAALVIVVGFARAIFATKGWAYYAHNLFFWTKIVVFFVIGGLSVPPTIAFVRWRRPGMAPSAQAIANVRRYLWSELALFALLPIFAAAMARGYGTDLV